MIVERWRPEGERPEILSEKLDWQPDLAFAPRVIELPSLFVETFGN
jgi:hypothetical protein